ncbi:Uma2 family endonuclease [Amycolatopsis sp. cg9]|uniref:Uma2 family endonuclease n=1 Tax=Amycolatopsis sp. cg9 TaxID=3238801 RepID=UPI00352658B4
MIALPEPGPARKWEIPDHLLTIEEYAALGETDTGFTELVEGRVVMSPGPKPGHNLVMLERVREDKDMIRAEEVAVEIEIVSPGSKHTDYHVKHDEYADAGIPHYWIVDITEPVSLVARHQAGEFGYLDASAVTGTFATDVPFPVKIDLDALLD